MRMFVCWILTLIGGLTTFVGLTMLVLLPIKASQNRDFLDQVKGAAVIVDRTGKLPVQFRYNGEYTGDGKMWVDGLDECDPSFKPPRSDRFVISFWHGVWWHCYGYPSGKTTLQTSVLNYLASEAGTKIFINMLIAAVMFGCAYLLRRGNKGNRDAGLVVKSACFAALLLFLYMFYFICDSTDDEFVKSPNFIKWFVAVCDVTLYPIGILFIVPINDLIIEMFPILGLDGRMQTFLLFAFIYIFWMSFGLLFGKIYKLSLTEFRNIRQRS